MKYCGDVINFKSYSKSYKMKRRIENPEENRAIFLNVHEAIIDRATWEKVQSMKKGTRRKRPTVTQEPSAFSGLLKCPECGGNLNFHFNQGNHDIKFFSCKNHNSGLRKCSKTHYIRLDFLERVVLYEINRLAAFANEYEGDFIKAMMGRSAKVAENDRARKQRELDGLLAQIENRLSTIARLGRAFGIHLILATQRPDANIIPGQIKNNMDFRVCGRADSVLSQIILDNTSAAEQIPKDARGRFISGDGIVFQGYLFDEGQL